MTQLKYPAILPSIYCDICSVELKYTTRSNHIKKMNSPIKICRSCSDKNSVCRKYHFDATSMATIDTVEKAYLLGWLATDGYANGYVVGIQLKSTDKQVVCDMFESVFGKNSLELKIRNRKAKYISSLDKTFCESSSVCGDIRSKEVVNDVRKHLGLKSNDKKSNSLRLPNLSTNELMWAMMRGIIEGDGTIRKFMVKSPVGHNLDLQVGLVSASKKFLQDIKTFLESEGIHTGEIGVQRKTHVFVICGDSAQMLLSKIYPPEVPPTQRLERKYLLAKQWVDNRTEIRSALLSKQCVACGTIFTGEKHRDGGKKYCSVPCRRKFYYNKSKRIV